LAPDRVLSEGWILITGAKELEAALRALPKATAKSVLRNALKNAAAPTVAAAERMAPIGPTGDLSNSITVKAQLKKTQQGSSKVGDVEMYVGATTPTGAHAHLIEFGTSKMSAKPFMRPAWESTKRAVLRNFERELWASLSAAAARLAKKAEAGTLGRAARKALGQ